MTCPKDLYSNGLKHLSLHSSCGSGIHNLAGASGSGSVLSQKPGLQSSEGSTRVGGFVSKFTHVGRPQFLATRP